ncbi:hypothetical protein [Kangiella aquimarina]|uniref:Uncharacterized protein n=1 Tax=Kangiella aquimarina TaxID=261965 RepID=A0ABZ0X5V7_9GAMM|nr:hypothetical protein [Kangiella aquimarina]WQG85900.1 hypothetical protein SR900_03210 [Kangiella aquimarina]
MTLNIGGNPKEFIEERGGMHDAVVESFTWESIQRVLTLDIDDLNSCFEGLPEYEGLCPITLVFSKVSSLDLNLQISSNQVSIYDFSILSLKGIFQIEIKCSPGGIIKLSCEDIEIKYKGK